MTPIDLRRTRLIFAAGGIAALAVLLLGFINQNSYQSVAAAAVVWGLASLSMLVLAYACLQVMRLLSSLIAGLTAGVLALKAIMVLIPLFVTYANAAAFMDGLHVFREYVDILFMALTGIVGFQCRKLFGKILGISIAVVLVWASIGLLINQLYMSSSGTTPAFLTWSTVLSAFAGMTGLGVGFLWLAFSTHWLEKRGNEVSSG